MELQTLLVMIYLSDKHQEREHTRVAKKIFDLTGIKYRKIDVTPELLKKLEDHLLSLVHDA